MSPRSKSSFVSRSAINADNRVINKGNSLLVPAAEDWADPVLRTCMRAHGEAHLRPHATWQEVSLIVAADTAILYWSYRAELTNDPSLGVNQKMNDSEAACCGADALGLRLGTTGCATGKQ